jgi:acylphosphatase
MDSDGSTKRMQVLFSGKVQGVGFRSRIYRIATPLCIVGYVRNKQNGDVELIAEGTERTLCKFIDKIRESHPDDHIIRERLCWITATGEFDKFRISD